MDGGLSDPSYSSGSVEVTRPLFDELLEILCYELLPVHLDNLHVDLSVEKVSFNVVSSLSKLQISYVYCSSTVRYFNATLRLVATLESIGNA